MSHGAAEACIVPEMHASPPDSGRVDQEKQLIVLIYQIRGLVIIVHVPYSHFRSSELFKRRLEDFFFRREKGALGPGRGTAATSTRARAISVRPARGGLGEGFLRTRPP